MIFSELYSSYYNAVARITESILRGENGEKTIENIITEKAFSESVLEIMPAIKSGRWQIIRNDMTTPLRHTPTMPLTELQKMWLKAISLDPKIKLFGVSFEGLDDIEPLFTPDDYCVYDKYSDGDPFEDENYVEIFRTVLSAIREKKPLEIEFLNRKGNRVFSACIPETLEYSQKDDKFRLTVSGCRYLRVVNLSRIISCRLYTGKGNIARYRKKEEFKELTLEITDERNALERCMLHFSHFEKQAERIGTNKYLLKIKYNESDETEMVIRVLSFGPMVKAIAPDSFVSLIKEKLIKQKNCGLF